MSGYPSTQELLSLQPPPYFATVQNGTAWLLSECQDNYMLTKDAKKEPGNATGRPSVTMPGTVDKIIPSPRPSEPDKAQIAVEGADHGYRDLRIENALTNEDGDDVRLKKGAHVEVTVRAESKASTAAINEGGNLAEIPPSYSAMSSAERSLYLKLEGFRLISHADPGGTSD
jgi:hypothetical protein